MSPGCRWLATKSRPSSAPADAPCFLPSVFGPAQGCPRLSLLRDRLQSPPSCCLNHRCHSASRLAGDARLAHRGRRMTTRLPTVTRARPAAGHSPRTSEADLTTAHRGPSMGRRRLAPETPDHSIVMGVRRQRQDAGSGVVPIRFPIATSSVRLSMRSILVIIWRPSSRTASIVRECSDPGRPVFPSVAGASSSAPDSAVCSVEL